MAVTIQQRMIGISENIGIKLTYPRYGGIGTNEDIFRFRFLNSEGAETDVYIDIHSDIFYIDSMVPESSGVFTFKKINPFNNWSWSLIITKDCLSLISQIDGISSIYHRRLNYYIHLDSFEYFLNGVCVDQRVIEDTSVKDNIRRFFTMLLNHHREVLSQ